MISDHAIAGVTILAIYQLVHGNFGVGLVHFNGLCRMIELRGGLAKLMSHNRALAQKPWRQVLSSMTYHPLLTIIRIDLEFALKSGLPMRFSKANIPQRPTNTGPKVIYPAYTKFCEDGASTELICLLSDVKIFTDTLCSIDDTNRLDPIDFSERAFILIHNLIDFAPLQGVRPSNATNDLLQLSLLAIMTTALPNYTADEIRYELLAKLLQRAIERYVASTIEQWKFLLWSVLAGRVSVLHKDHDTWVIHLLAGIIRRLEINSWDQLRLILGGYCWIHVTHDRVAIEIFEQSIAVASIRTEEIEPCHL